MRQTISVAAAARAARKHGRQQFLLGLLAGGLALAASWPVFFALLVAVLVMIKVNDRWTT